MDSFRFDPDQIVVGSVLRRVLPRLLSTGALRYDLHRPAALNDLVFGEITRVPSCTFAQLKYNFLERLYPHADGVKVQCERPRPGPCLGVVGNRYAPPYLIGGLSHPITGQINGEVRGGALVDGLFGVNAIGFVNHEADPEERVRISVRGVLVDERGRSLNLSAFREPLPDVPDASPAPSIIVVGGSATDAGKTTCAWALVHGLRSRGFSVTVEKKTGTSCCRDWLRCHADPDAHLLERDGDAVCFRPDEFPARDFVDGLGVASDVSAPATPFATASVRYTRAFMARARPDFHVIELADNLAHVSNVALLRSRYFRQRTGVLIYSGLTTPEAAAHFVAYVRALGYGRTPALLSGPLANEERYRMAVEEITTRLGLPVCRSATRRGDRFIPDGRELGDAVLAVTRGGGLAPSPSASMVR